jgi:hypothetical protein
MLITQSKGALTEEAGNVRKFTGLPTSRTGWQLMFLTDSRPCHPGESNASSVDTDYFPLSKAEGKGGD